MHLAHRHADGRASNSSVRRPSISFGHVHSLGRAQHDHRPGWSFEGPDPARILLDPAYLAEHAIDGGRHEFMHHVRVVPSTKCGV
jgi:hypothetical protein